MPARPDVAAVVLAAGQGTRFRSDTAKVLHRAAGRSLLAHVMAALRPLELGQIVVVVGHQAEQVREEVAACGGATTVIQHDQLGTGHAVQQALPALADGIDRVLVLPGDTPLLLPGTLADLLDGARATATLLTTEVDDPTGYGRIVRRDGGVGRIVEEADADADERAILEVNGGVYVFSRDVLAGVLAGLDADNAQGEHYLTDTVAALVDRGEKVEAVPAPASQLAGVNDRAQLAVAAAVLRQRTLTRLMHEGVTVVDPAATYVDADVTVGPDTVLLPGCLLQGTTRVGSGATVGPASQLVDAVVDDGATVAHSVVRAAHVGPGAQVGPFSHLRPGARLDAGSKTGAFVEVKNSTVGEGSKVPHLSYVGDTAIGRDVNIGAGSITVNYDGIAKHHTVVDDEAFVGCDAMLIAPVRIGRGAIVAAGSTITDDVPDGALAIARQRQTTKDGWARRRRERHDR